uniref:Subtilisin-like protease fibronectin type-III domain-containing protein n=1 Tax=Ananas comosus var. bracteatus TaxID=296719 RepID=A0A6V7PH25_ANACO|nr:unnamed protein product [Ananas comosus var. bracteatus]
MFKQYKHALGFKLSLDFSDDRAVGGGSRWQTRGSRPPEADERRERRGEYRVSIREPAGVAVAVEPAKLVFDREGRELEFRIRVSADAVKLSPGSARTESGR